MKRGIVMSIEAKHAVVMTADGRFVRAPLHGSPQIGEEIVFEEETIARRPRWNRQIQRYAGAAALLCLIVLSGLIYGIQQANPVVAYLTMDINPSIEIGVDSKEKVRKLRALNDDGKRIIEGIHYKGVHVDDVASAILDKASGAHYLDLPDQEILITSLLLNGKKKPDDGFESALTGKLDQRLQDWIVQHGSVLGGKVSIATLSIPQELRTEADANGVSSGKMALYLMAKDNGYVLELSELKERTVKELAEPMGGLQSMMTSQTAVGTKENLQKLLEKEKSAGAKATSNSENKPATGSGNKTPKPSGSSESGKAVVAKPTPKPSVKPSSKPSLKPSTSAKPWKPNGSKDRHDDDDDDDDRRGSGHRNDDDDDDHGRGGDRDRDDGDDDHDRGVDDDRNGNRKGGKDSGKHNHGKEEDRDDEGDDRRNGKSPSGERNKNNQNDDDDDERDDRDEGDKRGGSKQGEQHQNGNGGGQGEKNRDDEDERSHRERDDDERGDDD
ncbi:anti-sigma factor domain-containing protein [Paenibacillus sp. GCM10027627]|uniref:anti-sigma factor domain-containing protein n=1 Tax=unclassified Paenibacillus TaxID=185978 RepID=UPI003638E26F